MFEDSLSEDILFGSEEAGLEPDDQESGQQISVLSASVEELEDNFESAEPEEQATETQHDEKSQGVTVSSSVPTITKLLEHYRTERRKSIGTKGDYTESPLEFISRKQEEQKHRGLAHAGQSFSFGMFRQVPPPAVVGERPRSISDASLGVNTGYKTPSAPITIRRK